MKTATSTSLILAATIALVALVTPKAVAAGSDEWSIAEHDHSLKVGDVVFYDPDAGKHVDVRGHVSRRTGRVTDTGCDKLDRISLGGSFGTARRRR